MSADPEPVSARLFARAQQLIPGGVNSPVRAFRSVGGAPFFVQRAQGATLVTADGRELIDFVGTWGPAIHGHNHPRIKAAMIAAAPGKTAPASARPTRYGKWSMAGEPTVRLVPSIAKKRDVQQRHGSDDVGPSGWPAASPAGTKSSSLTAATTGTPIPSWSRPVPAR